MSIIEAEKLCYSYETQGRKALEDISFTIEKGQLAVFLGGSGAGKTTLTRLVDPLLPLEKGQLKVLDMDCGDEDKRWDIRSHIGIVFENFDDQFISGYAREDLGYSAINFLVGESLIEAKIIEALETVDMSGYADCSLQLLPFYMRQRIAIAGALVHDPDILIFDEPFSELDEGSGDSLMEIIKRIHAGGKTVLIMTKDSERAQSADKLFVMCKGKILGCGRPDEVFSDKTLLDDAGIKLPFTAQVYHDLAEAGVKLDKCPISIEQLVEEVCR